MKHVMIDLETMGTAYNDAIIQIGAAEFHPGESHTNGQVFFNNVSLTDGLLRGMTIDPNTLKWWMDQSKEAQLSLSKQPIGSLRGALDNLSFFLERIGTEVSVWSHGAAFDIAKLEIAYRLTGLKIPWSYKNVRDTRTLYWLAKEHGWLPTELSKDKTHNALEDAKHQAAEVQRALKCINER